MSGADDHVVQVVRQAYAAFNDQDIERAVATMDPDVEWPDVVDGGFVHGRDGVRRHWREVFATSRPHVEIGRLTRRDDGSVAVEVRQTVAGLDGQTVSDDRLTHVLRLDDGLITRMDIETH
jgi:uncharacterized protein (TIGR02246 family)